MKRLLVAFFLAITFGVYILHGRSEAGNLAVNPNSSPPNSNNNNSSTPPSQSNTPSGSSTPPSSGQYKDGTYTGSVEDAYYGNVQVQVTISGGQISDVQFLQYPNDRSTSRIINGQAMPYLKQEAIQAQSANVAGVSGATDTSQAFVASLINALNQAH